MMKPKYDPNTVEMPDISQEPPVQEQDPTVIEWIKQAQQGSRDAYLLLRVRYRPLIDASVTRHSMSDMSLQDMADMHEEAERVFLNALTTYDTEQVGVDFGLYAKICLRNGLVSEMRRLRARQRLGVVPLDPEEMVNDEDPAAALMEAERFHRLYVMIHEHLSGMENHVWWMYVAGVEVKEIAQRMGKDEKSIHNAIYRIRRKLRSLLASEI